MSKARRSAAAFISFALVIAACGDDDVETIPPATSTIATTAAPVPEAARTTITVAPPTTPASTPTTTATEAPGTITVEIIVVEGEATGPGTTQIDLGTEVVIVVTSDVEDEVHLHGYDVIANVGPSSAAVIQFVAEIPGVFEMELEDAGQLLLEIKVS